VALDHCPQLEFPTFLPDGVGFRAVELADPLATPAKPLRRLPEFETPMTGFSHAGMMFAFFTVRHGLPRCRPNKHFACAPGDSTSGGQAELARSIDRGQTFEVIEHVSTWKFQWLVPAIVEAGDIPGLVGDHFGATDQVLLMWGTGLERRVP